MRGDGVDEGEALARRLEWRIWKFWLASNLVSFGLFWIFGAQSEALLELRRPFNELLLRVTVGPFMGIIVLAALHVTLVRVSFKPVRRWLTEGRRPTDKEARATLAQPFRQGALSLLHWILGLVLFRVMLADFVVWDVRTTALTVVAFIGWGVVSAAITFLLVETVIRPVLPQTLGADRPAARPIASILTRLLLIGGLGSGWVLAGFLGVMVGATPEQLERSTAAIISAVGLSMIASLVLTVLAARSVSLPLRALRKAMGRVADGDLDTAVTIDDATEVGQLQAGFNRMIAGLRERERLRDLFGRHVGAEVATEALQREDGMVANICGASVMFIDVVGSTALAHERSPHEVLVMLNALFDAVVRVVGEEGGWVNKFVGDAALCVFGVPGYQDDHAARALRAARSLRREIDTVTLAHPGFNAAIGVSSGEVVAGNLGSEHRYEYTVIGDPVNEASRLTDEAKRQPSLILAAKASVAAAPGESSYWRETGSFSLRGRAVPTVAFEPRG